MTKHGKNIPRCLGLMLLIALVISCMVPGFTAYAAEGETTVTEDFSGYDAGAVNAEAMTGFTFGDASLFTRD